MEKCDWKNTVTAARDFEVVKGEESKGGIPP